MKENSFLLDTNVFIWWMEMNNRLPEDLYALINNPTHQICVSIASIWEISIKKANRKLNVPHDIEEALSQNDFQILPIEIRHILYGESLPYYHKDPFDRMLIAQANVEHITLITSDEKIMRYKVKTIKA